MSKMSSLISFPEFLAQTTAPAGQPQGGIPTVMIIGYLLLFAAMYFFMIAPQRKKQKEHEKMLKALESGDEIVTTGGIFGVITNVKEDRFVVRIADNTKIEIGKGFVQSVLNKTAAPADKK
ncbi:MAG: preprotein translocase subunit YajC [Opitutia bacterium Tous-C1TDCM]|nr:MAG: preprotein translocase subunit YajC [Opitutae bacterium Tous-C1TDCM]